MSYLLTRDQLLESFTEEQIEASTYKRGNREFIRLINTKPDIALVPALYPSIRVYRSRLKLFDNIPGRRVETNKLGVTNNSFMSLELTYVAESSNPNSGLPKLPELREE